MSWGGYRHNHVRPMVGPSECDQIRSEWESGATWKHITRMHRGISRKTIERIVHRRGPYAK